MSVSDEQLERLADMIADRLAARATGELITAAELAKRLGRSCTFVYDHAAMLGAVKLGNGPRPRLAFRWPQVLDRLTDTPQENPSARSDLLPIRRRVLPAPGGVLKVRGGTHGKH